MSDLGLEVGRQIDDVDGTEWTFLRADTAADTQTFRYESNLRIWGNFDT